ncbi:MAG: hypothetical protein HIU83_03685 [Proteobacteria bacterium]|nr:hypothetical protein [Pseudomonadota bacterium]
MPTSIKRLILPVSSSDDNFYRFDHAIIDLTHSEINLIREMSKIVNAAKVSLDISVYKLVTFNAALNVMTFDYNTDYLDNGRTQLKEPDDSRIDGACLNVTDDDLFWTFHPKNNGIHCEIESVTIAALETFDTLDCRESINDGEAASE